MKKNIFRLTLITIMIAAFLSSCAQATPAATDEAADGLRVAVVMPSTINDAAFSQSMYEGLKTIQTEMGGEDSMELAYSENMFNVPDAAAALRDYATQGYDLVIAHGSQYGTSLQQIAPDFPETSFAWGTSLNTFQADGINNVFAYQAEAQEGGYVLGTIAALMSESGIIGISGPVEAGDAKLYVDGFQAGVLATKPDATVNVTYTGSFSDVSLMAAAAETHIAAGADMLTGSSQSVVGAIGIAKDQNAFWFGTQWDQTSLAPTAVVASQVYDWTGILDDMISSRQAGVLGNKSYTLTFKNGGLIIQYNEAIEVPEEAKSAADAAIQGISDGTVNPLP
ncbi:MAG: BMP family ABC transporter substrate-binding protein [Chloroflexi bacterium]|nr:MAG: BMP family ABC transporter substrate-binding protein [Chloroflexota bacterium]